MSIFSELKRRNVLRVAAAYFAISWILIQVAQAVLPAFGVSPGAVRIVIIFLVIGILPAVIFSWVFEITPTGLKLDKEVDRRESIAPQTGKKLDQLIMVALALGLSYFAFDKFVLDPSRDARREESVAQQARVDALVESYADKSIAVLPFVNMSSDPEQEYFSDGIAEELLNLLASIPELRVISRSSAFSYKGKDIDIPTIAKQLNVAHVLEGSVRKAGNQVRITAQLIDARSDTHLWSETYERTLDDLFALQDEIASNVLDQLKLKILGESSPRLRTTDPAAYALFLQARHIRLQGTAEAYEKALELYQQALAIDPDYPPSLEGLAEMYVFHALYGLIQVDEAYRFARAAINKSLAIDPEFGVGVAGLGWIAVLYDHDMVAAARHFERAYALNPSDADVISGIAYMAEAMGRWDIAIAFMEYAVARDPMGTLGHLDLAALYIGVGRLDDGIASIRIGETLRPGHGRIPDLLAGALLRKGEPRAALGAIEQETFEVHQLMHFAAAYHDLGQQDKSDAYLQELIEKHAMDASYNIAGAYAWRGDIDLAFNFLEDALQNNDAGLSSVRANFWLNNLHDDPRWQPYLARLGKSDAQLELIEFNVTPPE